jgi:hypothetical protein
MSENHIDKIKEEARKANYSEEEINDFINMGHKFAGKSTITALVELVNSKAVTNAQKAEAARIVKKINKLKKYDFSGYISFEFKEFTHLLNVQMSISDKDYRLNIDIPDGDDYAKEILARISWLKYVTIAYWKQFCTDNKSLFKRICDFCNDVDFDTLKVSPDNPNSLYWDVDQPKRIVVFAYYTTSDGKALYKKQ